MHKMRRTKGLSNTTLLKKKKKEQRKGKECCCVYQTEKSWSQRYCFSDKCVGASIVLKSQVSSSAKFTKCVWMRDEEHECVEGSSNRSSSTGDTKFYPHWTNTWALLIKDGMITLRLYMKRWSEIEKSSFLSPAASPPESAHLKWQKPSENTHWKDTCFLCSCSGKFVASGFWVKEWSWRENIRFRP